MTNPSGRATNRGDAGSRSISVVPFTEAHRPFFRSIVQRLRPEQTASARDPAVMAEYFRRRGEGEIEDPAGTETFVAVGSGGEPLGVLVVTPSADYFTGHGRAYVEVLVVAAEAEGRGAGTALLRHAEAWARARSYREVALDVFADNARARALYERVGYRPDHIRLVKRLEGVSRQLADGR